LGIMNVSHPDIEAFIDAKMEKGTYRQFNLSVGITDEFMRAVEKQEQWPLTFNDRTYKTVEAVVLWEKITRNAYNSAEPGIIFIDRLNDQNNLYYCERIEATNPCAEQPLPPYGLCTLGSFNLVKYVDLQHETCFNLNLLKQDIHAWTEAYDNIFDNATYAIPEHKTEALNKRRIGLGFTGIANAIEIVVGKGCYGSWEFVCLLEILCKVLRDEAYAASVALARQRGSFPLYSSAFCDSKFIKCLPDQLQEDICKYGIRNSHLISYAPCGTISQCAGNISSGVEPIFHHEVQRDVYMKEGKVNVTLMDYNTRNYGFKGKTLDECSVADHMRVASTIQRYCDSAVSKTVNVASNCTYSEYEQIYREAHRLGLKGITVYRPNDIRGIVIKKKEKEDVTTQPASGYCANGACSM